MAPIVKRMYRRFIEACYTAMYLLSPIVAIYATMLIMSASLGMIHGQSTEIRLEKLEADAIDQRVSLDHRLTILETTLKDIQDSSTWFKISTGGTGMLLIKAVIEILGAKKSKGRDDDEN